VTIFPSEPRAPALPGPTSPPQGHPNPPTCGPLRLPEPHQPVTKPRRTRACRSKWPRAICVFGGAHGARGFRSRQISAGVRAPPPLPAHLHLLHVTASASPSPSPRYLSPPPRPPRHHTSHQRIASPRHLARNPSRPHLLLVIVNTPRVGAHRALCCGYRELARRFNSSHF